MVESAAGAGGVGSTEENRTPQWLIELKQKRERGERPRDKAYGRWLGDFLDQNTECGLLPTERQLLDVCARGYGCIPSAPKELSALLKGHARDTENLEALKEAVQPNRVRAEFLRFLALGGDESAPVHESGVQLHNAFVDTALSDRSFDLRGAKCVARLIVIDCYVNGAFLIEDATMGILVLQGSRVVAGINAGRAKLSGSAFLEQCFVDGSEVIFRGAEIGGSLQCSGAEFNGNLDCSRARFERVWEFSHPTD